MTQNQILVVGSLNMDQVVRVTRVPALGETLLGAGSLKLIPGGKGANQAVAIARLGTAVAMAGRVGNDPFGERLLGALQADHVDTGLIAIDQEEASGVAFIFLDPDGDNAIVVAPGANMRVGLDHAQTSNILASITQAQALVMQLEIPLETVVSLTAAAHNRGVPVVLNLAPAQPLPKEVLQQLDVLIVNEAEASLLSGQRVESLAGARVIYQSAPKVPVVDTTAAGDCFVGALTVALTEGQTPEDALRFAVYASALKVTKFGAQSGLPTRAEVEAFLHQDPQV